MPSNPQTLIDPAQLPVDPVTCKPVYPHQYLKVNTVFEVARAAGLRTAWSDKQDRDVPLVVSGDPIGDQEINTTKVETTQIAPTILRLLGLSPNTLRAVQIEHTRELPLDD